MSQIEAVIVIVLETGEVKSSVTSINPELTDEAMTTISAKMNENLIGMDISEINIDILSVIKQSVKKYSQDFEILTKEFKDVLTQEENIEMALTGATNMFDYPEFHSIEKAKSFMDFLSQRKEVQKLFDREGISKNDINIVIGNENMGDIAKEVSIISANLNYEGAIIGKIGIIAPIRMDYNKAGAIVSFIQSQINTILNDS